MKSVHRYVPVAAAAVVLGLSACGDASGPRLGPPSSILLVTPGNQTGPAGQALASPLVVRVRDAQGQDLSGVAVSFTVSAGGGSVAPAVITTDADGLAQAQWTLGTQAGTEQRVDVRVVKDDGSAITAAFTATAATGPPALLTRLGGDGQVGGTGARLADSLVVQLTDQFGNGISGAAVTWTAAGGTISTPASLTGTGGRAAVTWTLGSGIGPATVTATAGSLPAVTFSAAATLGITSVTPAVMRPGDTLTISGANLSPSTATNVLRVADVIAPILSATATEIRAVLPATMPCLPGGNTTVTLVSGGVATSLNHPILSARARAIAVGEVAMSSPTDVLDCIELPLDGSRYLIAVTNTSPSINSVATLRLRATASSLGAAVVGEPVVQRAGGTAALRPHAATSLARRAFHDAFLRHSIEMLDEMVSQPATRAALRARVTAQQVVPSVGDTLNIRVPRVSATGTTSCTSFDEVRARVAVVGTRGVVLEDVANPLANQVDSYYQQLSADFDATQYDVVLNNFGDPLRLDAQLDNNGRLFMMFSHRVPSDRVAGFVYPGDFLDPAQCAQSNQAEVFYGYVPTVNDPTYNANTVGEWFWSIRATVVHEVKHIASFAARLSNGVSGEEQWLEESTAMIAEELWARGIFGYTQGGNTGYLQSIGCEVRGALPDVPWALGPRPECSGRPGVTWLHFFNLADWLEAPSTRSPLGSSATGDGSFYGSGWLFVRWLLDHASDSEANMLRSLNDATVRGAANVETRFGRPFDQLVSEWALATALDDRPGFQPPDARFTVPSWNLRNVFAGLNVELQGFPIPFPLLVRTFGFGNADLNEPAVRGGGTAYFELSGTPTVRQALEFTAAGGAPLSSAMRISIVRLQ